MGTQGIDPKVEKDKRIKSDQEYLKTEKRKETLFKEAWNIYLDENKKDGKNSPILIIYRYQEAVLMKSKNLTISLSLFLNY
ncbi:hypothetical protein ACFODO_14450 [Acinetobacter sichuanensis]|uniref:Uncharacterized protein n=1 Tax=Acinetobacter sichuanensis TaxID=2136183 RepID=A0A371YNJ0_9GAMM|nr:hypothetical protein [Acinetobacter sichuanensis]RFC83045.1 hypothetical protein C9E89_013675 [Acinetobacter sichuanensis]